MLIKNFLSQEQKQRIQKALRKHFTSEPTFRQTNKEHKRIEKHSISIYKNLEGICK